MLKCTSSFFVLPGNRVLQLEKEGISAAVRRVALLADERSRAVPLFLVPFIQGSKGRVVARNRAVGVEPPSPPILLQLKKRLRPMLIEHPLGKFLKPRLDVVQSQGVIHLQTNPKSVLTTIRESSNWAAFLHVCIP